MDTKKKVSFANDGKPTAVHHLVTWKFAMKQARKGNWEHVVADRHRFQRRIDETALILNPIIKSHSCKKMK